MTLYKELGEAETCKTQTWHGYLELVLKAISTVSTQSVNQLAKNYNIKIQLQVDHSMCWRVFSRALHYGSGNWWDVPCSSSAPPPLTTFNGRLSSVPSIWASGPVLRLIRSITVVFPSYHVIIMWLSCDIPLISYLHACQSCHFLTVALRSCRPQPFRSTACLFFLVHVTFILKSSQMVQKGVPVCRLHMLCIACTEATNMPAFAGCLLIWWSATSAWSTSTAFSMAVRISRTTWRAIDLSLLRQEKWCHGPNCPNWDVLECLPVVCAVESTWHEHLSIFVTSGAGFSLGVCFPWACLFGHLWARYQRCSLYWIQPSCFLLQRHHHWKKLGGPFWGSSLRVGRAL